MKSNCPTCGSKVEISNGTTNYFIPINVDEYTENVVLNFEEWKIDNGWIHNKRTNKYVQDGCVSGEFTFKEIYQLFSKVFLKIK